MIIRPRLGRQVLFYETDVHYMMVRFALKVRAFVVFEGRKVLKGTIDSSGSSLKPKTDRTKHFDSLFPVIYLYTCTNISSLHITKQMRTRVCLSFYAVFLTVTLMSLESAPKATARRCCKSVTCHLGFFYQSHQRLELLHTVSSLSA
jgi:hypothetical protein